VRPANSPSEIDTAELIRRPSPSNVTVTVLPNVDHAHGLAEAPRNLTTAMVAFLSQTLLTADTESEGSTS
jgi:hypothetical protein